MASGAKSSAPTAGSAVFLAWAIHLYAWFFGSVLCVLANAIHLFLPPWFVFPVVGWAVALSIHGVVTYFIVDKLGGSWSQLSDQYVWRHVPEPVKARAKAVQAKIEAKVA